MNEFDTLKWYVLYTRPRHEKFVESELLQRGLEAFTPKITLRRKWSDRITTIKEPLFKGYCFAKFFLQDKTRIISQRGVVDLVHFKEHYIPVPESVINSLKILTENNIRLDPCPYLKVGDRVVIRRGALKGVEGFITEKRNGNTSLVISVDAIVSSMQCIIDSDCVELA